MIFIIGTAAGGLYLKSVFDYQNAVKATCISDIPLDRVSDSVYTGEYDVGFVRAKAEVAVENGKMTNIKLIEHKNDRGGAAESVVAAMLAEQRVTVDSVAGATNSSTVIKKAVENVLNSAINK